MPLPTWIALGFLVVALAGSLTVAVVRGLAAWRAFQSFSTAAGPELDKVNASAATAEARTGALTDATERLEGARARLEHSLAELAVLRAAANEVNATIGRVTAAIGRVRPFVPRRGRA